MKASKRIVAMVLSVCMAVGSMGMQVQAYGGDGRETELAGLQELPGQTAEDWGEEAAEGIEGKEPDYPGKAEGTKEDSAESPSMTEGKEGDLEENSGNAEEVTGNLAEIPSITEGMAEDAGERPSNTEGEKEDAKESPSTTEGTTGDSADIPNTAREGQGKAEQPEKGQLNFIMQEMDRLGIPSVQNVAASLGEDGSPVESASLKYHNDAGQEFTAEAAGLAGNMVKFSMEYTEEGQAGIYRLDSIFWRQGGKQYQADLADLGMEIVYGVNKEVQAEPDEVLLDEGLLKEVEANVVTLDENGKPVSESTLDSILEEAGGQRAQGGMVRGAAKNMVIVLDPGHDSTHSGASYYGYKEQDLVLKIAKYCKAELQKYAGITIYMTRETQACANGGSSVDTGTCNARRVEFAAAKKANVYVSFHLNASPSTAAKGVGVYYPNGSYRPDIGEAGKGLATEIYQKLAALGLSTWASGILIRNSENNTLYPDGSLADYLAVIRRSKLAGFPAVLIEHAFLSNSGDVSQFLNSDAKLKNLGVADAQGIANYYGLSLAGSGDGSGGNGGEPEPEPVGPSPEISSIQSRNSAKLRISWNLVPNAVSYEVYRSSTLDGKYSKIATVAGTKASYDDSTVQAGVSYYYKVCTVFKDGKLSGYSKAYSGKTLASPQITKAVSKNSSQIEITWNGVADAAKYELYQCEIEDGSYEKIKTLKAGQVSYIDGDVESQTTYYYKVRARGGEKNGYSSYSKPYSGWAVKKTKVLSVSSKTKTSLEIKWRKVSKAYGYRIQRSDSKTKGFKTIATIKSGATVSYVDKKLKTGRKYYYRVQALNRVNKKIGYSGYSSASSGSTITGTTMVYARSKNSASMEVAWNKDPKATGYRVKRSTTENGGYQVVAEINKNSTVKYIDKTISTGKKYYYAIESVVTKNGVPNYSGNSKPVMARNIKRVTVTSMTTGEKGVTLNWAKVAGANSYQITRSETANGKFTQIAKLQGSSNTSYTDTSTAVGKRYFYKIRAIKDGKNTGYGTYTKALEKSVLKAPEDLAAISDQPGQVELSWEKVPKSVGYAVYRSTKQDSGYKSVAALEGIGTVAYIDTNVAAGKTYYYKVAAILEYKGETGPGDTTGPIAVKVVS